VTERRDSKGADFFIEASYFNAYDAVQEARARDRGASDPGRISRGSGRMIHNVIQFSGLVANP
jgi:hypothetical protein